MAGGSREYRCRLFQSDTAASRTGENMITVDCNRIRAHPGDRVLDIGCGPGRHACRMYEMQGVQVIGMDASFADVCEARERLRYHEAIGAHGGGSWAVAAGDITELAFRDACFDLVICSEVMEHIPNDSRAARELMRIVKPGGMLVASVPRYYPE
ncbi:MAG TPA: class I SAM-dependent methyltransferase, partial [Desulfosalsimonadaceae bacterium]|nr:class I SAM-dependent methyltransferase [Desulfosalsimonadaceae bacterium]